MSKNITSSFVIIALVALAASAGTLAYFTDSETSTGNTFTSGTMDLVLVDGGTPTFTEWWMTPDMKPGDETGGSLQIYNVGTIEASEMNVSFATIETDLVTEDSDTLPGSALNMSKLLKVTFMQYKDVSALNLNTVSMVGSSGPVSGSGITDLNGNGYIDLHDLSQTTLTLDAPPAVSSADHNNPHKELSINILFVDDVAYSGNSEKNNDYQGDTTELLVQFDLVQ